MDSWLWVGGASSFVVWVASASGFWLCFLDLSCCASGCCSVFNGFCGGLLMTVVVVVVLFSVFCFAMDCSYHGGGGGGGTAVDVIYWVRYIILLCCLYHFNV